MAFEIPLDADRVDDMNLFSQLVRAPVIGTLLWILGGSKAREEEDGGNDQRLDDDDGHDVRNSSSLSSNGEFRQTRSSLKKAAPSLAASEISECDLADSLDAVSLYGYGGSSATHCIPGMTKKELSWSDDAGRDLVVYETEVRISNCHAPVVGDIRRFVRYCHLRVLYLVVFLHSCWIHGALVWTYLSSWSIDPG
jgi:hypothetical protein